LPNLSAYLFLILFILSIGLTFFYLLNTKNNSNAESLSQQDITKSASVYKTLNINGKVLNIKVADNKESRERGLSGVKDFSNFGGMLFIFPFESIQVFWMKDMFVDLDIVWLNKDKKVIGIEKNVSKNTYNSNNSDESKLFTSSAPILYVLELPSGSSETLEISVGEVLDF
jgi:uncharacterized membrane protein (UPF0127 family)